MVYTYFLMASLTIALNFVLVANFNLSNLANGRNTFNKHDLHYFCNAGLNTGEFLKFFK